MSKSLYKDVLWQFAGPLSDLRTFHVLFGMVTANCDRYQPFIQPLFDHLSIRDCDDVIMFKVFTDGVCLISFEYRASRKPLFVRFKLFEWLKVVDFVFSLQHTDIVSLDVMKRFFTYYKRASISSGSRVNLLICAVRFHIVPILIMTSQFRILFNTGLWNMLRPNSILTEECHWEPTYCQLNIERWEVFIGRKVT